ncbi:hypothetical protein CPB83DRAFT_911795 [Crepidotus variabilis]|uniref:Uncharacterized protein n=1 Tax=Crepidotus variabilis TaxID=179855 RepID=A0A9P6E2M0_9AGAR|nr:hypothetical protein CPB83DRAFT_911795 [Crepidotus variabilis]
MMNDANERAGVAAQTRAEELSRSLGIYMHERRLLQEVSIRLQVENNELLATRKTESERQEYLTNAAHAAWVEAECRAQEAARTSGNAIRQKEMLQQKLYVIQESQAKELAGMEDEVKRQVEMRENAFRQQEMLQQKFDNIQEMRAKELAGLEDEVKRQAAMREAAERALAATEIRAAEAYQTAAILVQEKQALETMVTNLYAERDASFQRELDWQFRLMTALRRVEELEVQGRFLEELYHLQNIQLQEYQRVFSQQRKENTSGNDPGEDIPMKDSRSAPTPPPAFPQSPPPSPTPASFEPPPVPTTLRGWFLSYEQRWEALQRNDCRYNLTFAHIPWPVSRFVARLEDLDEEEIKAFLTKKDQIVGIQWRDEVKRWHTDRFARVAARIHPAARNDVLTGFNRCIQIVTLLRAAAK